MKVPASTKPLLWGIAIGAVLVAMGGSIGLGWKDRGQIETIAAARADAAVKVLAVEALAPLCFERGSADPQVRVKLADISKTSSSSRIDALVAAGWTIEGLELSTANKRAFAEACTKLLVEAFPPA